jgi:hypothetical protein
MMHFSEAQVFSGARKILSKCLGLEHGDDVLIFCDETTIETAAYLAQSARDSGIEYAILCEPVDLQPYHYPDEELPWPVKAILDRICAVLTCLNDHPECLPFRKRIIANGQGKSRRIGHMPGASRLTLAVADADYGQIQRDCANLAMTLARGRNIRLTTEDARGREHILEADIGRWDPIPVASDGLIPRGAWGNIPGGEAYIAPILGTANGQIVINVALPGLPFYRNEGQRRLWQEEVCLFFEDGVLVDYIASSDASLQVLEREKKHAEAQRDSNWNNLAEIGLGTNKSIRSATGISLLDEKMYGTAHIAIGDNIHHGGTNKSVIHCDMVTFAHVDIDGRAILDGGHICLDPSEWLERFSEVCPEEVKRVGAQIRYSGNEYVLDRQNLYKVLGSSSGRRLNVPVGDSDTAKRAAHVLRLLPVDRCYVSVASLVERAGMPPGTLLRVLQLLCDYQLAEVRTGRPD